MMPGIRGLFDVLMPENFQKLIMATKVIRGLFDVLMPENFQKLIMATKVISGYNVDSKTFAAPSLALHMGTSLKMICDIALKTVIEKRNLPNIEWTDRNKKKGEIKDLKKLIEGHWCNELSSLALKDLNEKHWNKSTSLPSTNDIHLFQNHTNKLAEEAFDKLSSSVDVINSYRTLTE
ncbi:hypothetical protein QE152_g38044 [Popillia japonica]|uniref:Uncharacterized protein n=1 Tax=Popillia japonica TaxID=7064 RepID=A0AAW1I912_POPJA